MHNVKKKGFTLIELIAVLVIMAIIALIATPLVMSIIRSARISADKRSIDAYGRSIELAIAGYLLDTGKFPAEVSQLTIEYSGSQVVCETTQINTDSSVYLSGCTVGGRSVENYTYGEDKNPSAPSYSAYTVGDQVTYNNINYYVIKDSSASEDSVALLKAEPLTVAEVNQYGGVGTANNHVNMYNASSSDSYYQTARDMNVYGGMAYYSSSTCNSPSALECITSYAQSEIKYVVDAWKTAKAPSATEARLITFDELTEDLGFEFYQIDTSSGYAKTENTPSWAWSGEYTYWTMSQGDDSSSLVWLVYSSGALNDHFVFYSNGLVRPVIILPKSALN